MLMLSFRESTSAVHAQRRTAIAGYAIIFLTFGVMGGWAAVTPLNRGVVAQGVVMVEDNRKVVEHFEGGIVKRFGLDAVRLAVKKGETK